MTRRDIPGYEKRYAATIDGKIYSYITGTHLKQQLQHAGYRIVGVSRLGEKPVTKSVSVLVARAWHGERPTAKHQVNHIDGDKDNNAADNLEYCTPSENAQHARKNGLNPIRYGEDTSSAKLKDSQVSNIKHLYASGFTQRRISAVYGVDPSTISLIVTGKRWPQNRG